jgi:hypothetical protein
VEGDWEVGIVKVILGRAWVLLSRYAREVQYPALSLRLRNRKTTPTCMRPWNPQIKLGNFNIWTNYLVVYELYFPNQYLVCQPFAMITAAHLSGILDISPSITSSRRFAHALCKIWNNWVSASSPLPFSESRSG